MTRAYRAYLQQDLPLLPSLRNWLPKDRLEYFVSDVVERLSSDGGGRTAAVRSSLIATCKRLDIDSFAYACHIFERISVHPQNRLAELPPDLTLPSRRSGPETGR